jgi:hypothetical protein
MIIVRVIRYNANFPYYNNFYKQIFLVNRMPKYVMRIFTCGWDLGDNEGPFYRYFYEKDMRSAYHHVRRDRGRSFTENNRWNLRGVLELAVKPVGKNKRWCVLFDRRKEEFEYAMQVHKADVERAYGKYRNF